ncbi:MAG: DNA (cytosine-5-)-methyltransferase [Clostridiaceae bacterium]
MNDYITVQQAAIKWSLSPRRVQILCSQGRILGAVKQAGVWLMPESINKPTKLKKNTPNELRKPPINVLSLFSGCGGMDLGFEGDFNVHFNSVNHNINKDWSVSPTSNPIFVKLSKTRFHTIFANDIREDAKIAWVNYFSKKGLSDNTYCLNSIVDLVKLQKENDIRVFPQNVDIVTGGFPCQDFSVAGKRLGLNSDKSHLGKNINNETPNVESRGQLYIWMREVIALTKPKMFVAENVKGLVNLADVKEIIEKDFRTISENGYLVVSARVLHAADYGIPQSRERVIFLGFNKSALKKEALEALSQETIPLQYDPYPPKTHSYTIFGEDLLSPTTLEMALNGLGEPENSTDPSHQKYSKAKYMGKHCQGQSEIKMSSIGPTIRSEHHGNIEFRRLSSEHGGKYINELENGLKERRLTVRECARIQTFPDEYQFVIQSSKVKKGVSASDAYKILGNAVPPLLAYNIAKQIERKWELYFEVEGETDDSIK